MLVSLGWSSCSFTWLLIHLSHGDIHLGSEINLQHAQVLTVHLNLLATGTPLWDLAARMWWRPLAFLTNANTAIHNLLLRGAFASLVWKHMKDWNSSRRCALWKHFFFSFGKWFIAKNDNRDLDNVINSLVYLLCWQLYGFTLLLYPECVMFPRSPNSYCLIALVLPKTLMLQRLQSNLNVTLLTNRRGDWTNKIRTVMRYCYCALR